MLTFDAGQLAQAVRFLAEHNRILEMSGLGDRLFGALGGDDRRSFYLKHIRAVRQYCKDAGFLMTEIPLGMAENALDDPRLTVNIMAGFLYDAMQRLRDEASIPTLLRLSIERVKFYKEPRADWEEVIARFPATVSDIEEANICFSLERYAACVFHCVQVVESGLIALGGFIGVQDPKSGWTSTGNELDRIIKKKYPDLTTFEAQYIEFFKQIRATVVALQDAWRNKISHAQGRLAVMTADFSPRVAEEILMASRGFMRRLATDLPPVGA
jgi:hypothetical protein